MKTKTAFSLASSLLLLAATSLTSQAQPIWMCGTNDNGWPLTGTDGGPDANFVQENGSINALPGSPDSTPDPSGADNDYYFAGIYTNVIASVIASYGDYTPVGEVAANENAAERAFAAADDDLRYHFNLPTTLKTNSLLTVIFDALNLDSPSDVNTDVRYGIEVYFNAVLVQSQIVIHPADLNKSYTTPAFTLASVNAQVGPGFDNIVSLKGINYNADGGGNWMGIDFVQLNTVQPATISITQQPQSVTTAAATTATFTVGATTDSSFPLTYQWKKGGADIAGATGASYTTPVLTLADNGSQFVCALGALGANPTNSQTATLTVTSDTTPPTLVRALRGFTDDTKTTVLFSEAMQAASANLTANYTINNGITVSAAALQADGRSVVLTTSPINKGTTNSLTINGLLDLAGNQLAANSSIEIGFGKGIYFVTADPGPLTFPGDIAVNQHLLDRGFDVELARGSDVPDDGSTAVGRDLIIQSSSLGSGTVEVVGADPIPVGKFKNLSIPAMEWEASNVDAFGFQETNAVTTAGQTQVDIVDASSQLAAGFPKGLVTVTTAPETFSQSTPVGAHVVATLAADSTQDIIYYYDKGEKGFNDFVMPARRVFFFFQDNTAAVANDNGWKLFDAAVDWLLGIEAAPPVTQPPTGLFTISVNFQGRIDTTTANPATAPLAATDVAGVVPAANWNNVDDAYGVGLATFVKAENGTTKPLVDSTGAATPVTLTFAANDSWYNDVTNATTGNAKMMNGVIKQQNTNTSATFTFKNVPDGQYDVLVYTDSNNDNVALNISAGNQTNYTIATHQFTNTSTFVRAKNTNPSGPRDVGNYVKLSNVASSGGSLGIVAKYISGGDGLGLAGIQILPAGSGQPSELGQTVNGFQDDFTGTTRDPKWVPVGPGGNLYKQNNGLLSVTVKAGDPNHLLYEAPGYSNTVQEVLARIRVTAFAPAPGSPPNTDAPRGGIGVGVGTNSQGINLHFRDNTQDGVPGRQFKLLDDSRAWGPPGLRTNIPGQTTLGWANDTWYWLRLRQEPNANGGTNDVSAKVWVADGVTPEPVDWQLTWNYIPARTARTGFAGITGSSIGGVGNFDVDYILIKAEGLPSIKVDFSETGPPDVKIGLNFGANAITTANANTNSTLAVNDVAGVPGVAQANWNNLRGQNGTNSTVVAADGAATSVTVKWDSNGIWASSGVGEENNKFPAGADRTLLTGYLDTGDATTSHITITNIPAALTSTGYDLYVYAMGGVAPTPTQGRAGGFRILDATTKAVIRDYVRTTSPSNATSYIEVPQNLGTGVYGVGNYLVFRGLTASGITLEATTVSPLGRGPTPRAPVNALQLVPAAGNAIANGLVAYWNFDGDLLDSINGFDGTSIGKNPVGFVDGKAGFGDAIKLDGTNYVDITGANQNGLDFPKGSVSIAGWFKVDAFDKAWQALISKGENLNYRVARRDDGTKRNLGYAGGVAEGTNDVPPVDDGNWHHFVAISDATGAAFGTALYLDGVIHGINTNKPALTANAKDLFIGENPDATGRQWKGEIDDVAIWNRVLTPTEIGTLYNAGTGTPLSALSTVSGLIVQDVNRPGDPIVATSTNSPAAEGVANSEDDKSSTKYLNFDKLNTGFTVTPTAGWSVVDGIALTSANDAPERDPTSYKIEGSTDGTTFALLSSNSVPTFTGRHVRQEIFFTNTTPYTSYRVTFPTVANAATANSMQIAEVELLGTLVADSIPNGLVAYWNFDGNLLDSINGFDGTSIGKNPVGFVDGKAGFGDAIKLDGTNYVDITGANQNGLDFPKGSVSIAGWFKVDAFDKAWQALISKGENLNYRVARRDDGTKRNLGYAGGVAEGTNDVPPVDDGNWHHFVAISDATGAAFGTALYLDGVIHGINTNKPALTANAKDLFIGENPDATGRQWKGEIDDVAIWNRVLTPVEITVLYNGGTGTPLSAFSSVAGLVEQDVNRPGDPIVATSTNSPAAEGVANSQDDKSSTKYLNFDKLNTGFTVTPGAGSSVVTGIALTSANDAPERDPTSYKIEGSTDGTTFTLVSSNSVATFTGRHVRQVIHFDNTAAYTSYRVTFPTVANAATANSMQIAEVELLGTVVAGPPGPVFTGISIQGNNVVITWAPATAVLQSATSVSGPYTDVAGASGGTYNAPLTDAQRYFRFK